MAGKIETAEVKAQFDKYDRENSGAIDAKSLENLFKDLKWGADAQTIRRASQMLDQEKRGSIEWTQFQRWSDLAWSYDILKPAENGDGTSSPTLAAGNSADEDHADPEHHSMQMEILRSAFTKYDKDGSGTIESSELSNLLTDLGWSADEDQVQKAMEFLDSDGSGDIQLNEFLQWGKFAWSFRVLGQKREKLSSYMAALASVGEEDEEEA